MLFGLMLFIGLYNEGQFNDYTEIMSDWFLLKYTLYV